MDTNSWFNPRTAFTVACAAFSALAISTAWRNQHIPHNDNYEAEAGPSKPRPENRRRHAVDSIYAPDGYAAFQAQASRSPSTILQDLLQGIAQLSQRLRALRSRPESRWTITSLLSECSLLATTIYRLQQAVIEHNDAFSRDPGRAAYFDTTISFVCDIVNSAELEIKKPSMSTGLLQEALQQLKDQRPALENLLESPYAAVMPPTPPPESYTVAALQHQGSSVSLMPPFQPSTGLTPGGDNRCWLEPPPEYSPPTHGFVVPGEKAEKQQPEVEPPEAQNQPAEEVYDTDALYNSITTNDLALMNDLLTLGADPNAAVGELQRTALHQAAHLNHTTCLTSLLRNGAGMSTEDSKGDTPLHLAAWAGHCEALDALLAHGADVDWLSGRDAYSPLWCAISAGHIDAARLLLKHGARVSLKAEGGLVPLHQAAVTGQSAMCELLLDRGAQIDSVDENGQTALAYAAASGSVPTVRVLLKHGANVEAAQTQGLTPAHWAAHKGHAEVLALLIAYGAKINARTLEGAAPLHLAANRGHAKATRLLLDKGADPKLVAGEWDGVSGTPAQMARAKGHERLAASITSS